MLLYEDTVKRVGNTGMVAVSAALLCKRVRVRIEVIDDQDAKQDKP